MGLLVVGTPLAWEESKKYIPHVKKEGVTQFLALYDRLKGRPEEPLLWGDEVSPASLPPFPASNQPTQSSGARCRVDRPRRRPPWFTVRTRSRIKLSVGS